MVINRAVNPCGNRPWAVKFVKNGADCPPFMWIKPNVAAPPRIIKAKIAKIFILENQNSVSPKALADSALRENKMMAKIAHHTQTGESGNHLCMSWPAESNSSATVTDQPNQYSQPSANPVPGPINFVV